MTQVIEHAPVYCPTCFEQIFVAIDLSACNSNFSYDCEVCCRPMNISVSIGHDGVPILEAQSE